MTSIDAVVEAVAKSHGVDIEDIRGRRAGIGIAYVRRLAIYVAHTKFHIGEAELAMHFGRRIAYIREALTETAASAWTSQQVANDIDDAVKRARALLEAGVARGEAIEIPADLMPSPLDPRQREEARRLRRRGWTFKGLANRYGVPETAIARLCGETIGGLA